MWKFAFISTNWIKKYYEYFLSKEKNSKNTIDLIKVLVLWILILICMFVYFRYVSLASTQGFFYRQASNQLSSVQFLYEIQKTEIMEKMQRNRNNMYSTKQAKTIIDVPVEFAQTAWWDKELSFNDWK